MIDGERQSIIVVDDETDSDFLLELILTDRGYDVETYTEPDVALANFKPSKYDLAILDLKMEPIEGFDLYQQFKKIDENIKVLFLSADGLKFSQCKKSWPADSTRHYLHKPSEIGVILSNVEEILPLNRQNQAFTV